MVAIRRVARREPTVSRDDFIKELATELGYRRLGSNIHAVLSGHIRAAVRRDILQTNRGEVKSWKIKIDHFTDDDLRAALIGVTRKRTTYSRPEVMTLIARHLGFGKLTQNIKNRLKSTLNSAIRRDIIERVGNDVRRT